MHTAPARKMVGPTWCHRAAGIDRYSLLGVAAGCRGSIRVYFGQSSYAMGSYSSNNRCHSRGDHRLVSGTMLDKQANYATASSGFSKAIEVSKVSKVNKRSATDARGFRRIHNLPCVQVPGML